jgi:hypothetical protein
MDTDDLSQEAYRAIIIEADKFHEDLTLQFGVMAYSCGNEREYLAEAKKLIKEIKSINNSNLSDIFFSSPQDKKHLHSALEKILNNMLEVEKIPENKRHYDF